MLITQTKLKKRGLDTKYVATLLAIGIECDIAMLTVDNDEFWEGLSPVQFGDFPAFQDVVTVVGYPIGGDTISVTSGVVSRIEILSYVLGSTELLELHINAAINSGNSRGLALIDKRNCIGIAFQSLKEDDVENISYVIPTPFIMHFIQDYEKNGSYTSMTMTGGYYHWISHKVKGDWEAIFNREFGMKNSERIRIINFPTLHIGMTLCSSQNLSRWIDQFRGHEADFISYRLASAFELIPHTINLGFMSHMQSRWNSETRSFHLRGRKFCPTVEEFRGILKLPKTFVLTLCPIDSAPSLAELMQQEFGFTITTCRSIIKDEKLNLQHLSDIVLTDTPVHDVNSLATFTVLLAHYFLAPLDCKSFAQIFKVAHTLKNNPHDISMLILVETIMGLNVSSLRYVVLTRGSPMVLFVWLLDKLSYITLSRKNSLIGVHEQQQRLKASTEDVIVPETQPIRETIPWYMIQKLKYEMDDMPMITLFGLEHSVSYYTIHLYGQFEISAMSRWTKLPIPLDEILTKKLFIYYDKR